MEGLLHQVSDSEFTPEKAEERRQRCQQDDLAFCSIYFPKLFDSPFNDLHKEVAGWTHGNYTLAGSRRFGKSAFVYVGKVIKHIALGRGGIVNISLYTDDNARERTASLSRIIQNNKLLCYDYNLSVIQDLKGYHIFKCDGGQTTMVATSVRQGLRALMDDDFKRFRLSVGDDLYSKNLLTQNLSEKVVDFVTSEMWGQMETDGLSITIGNASSELAPIKYIADNHTKLTGRHYSLPAMNQAEDVSNWPERFSVEDLHAIRDETDYDVWMGDYMDEPVEMGDMLDPQWIRFVNVNLIKIVSSISVVDPAHGDSPAACNKGMATVGICQDSKIHVLDMYLRKEGYLEFFDYALEVRRSLAHHKVLLFENDFAQWNFADPYYQQWLQRVKKPLPIVPFHSSQNRTEHRAADKESRMMNLVHPHQTGKLDYNEQIKDSADFKDYKNKNYLVFGKHRNKKLDGLDALASAYIMIWSYMETGHFKPLKKRDWNPDKMKGWFR